MSQDTTVHSHEDISMTTISHHTTDNIRAKSVDYPRIASPRISSFKTRSSMIYIDELRRKEAEEERGLNLLNNRFANYLEQIKNLGKRNIHLRRQIDDIHQKYTKHIEEEKPIIHKNSNAFEIECNHLRQQLNNESQKLISSKIRLQRADHDQKYYQNQSKFFSTTEQIHIIKQQFDASLYELNQLKEQYRKQEQNLQSYKNQYNEYITKLTEYATEYDNITFERIKSENRISTLKEQLSFEREYNQRCKEEFEQLEKIQYDSNNRFNKTEIDNIIQKIRQDYQKYNETQLFEFESVYKLKFDSIQNDFHQIKNENYSEEIKSLTERNQSLQQKLTQLETNLHHLTEQNQQQYDILNQEYQQLETQIPQFNSSIQNSLDNTIHLTSEINIYRCLLINLVQKPKPKPEPADFTVHFGNGIIWVRI